MKSYALVALGIALLAAAPLTYPGPLQTHMGFGPLFALMGDAYAAQSIAILPLGVSRALVGLGLTPVDELKSTMALAFLLGALGMFVLGARVHGAAGGLIASSVYSLLPYRLMTAYVRGDLGESLFLGLLPVLLAGAVLMAGAAPTSPFKVHRLAASPPSGAKGQGYPARGLWLAALGLALVLLTLTLWRLCVPFAPDPTQAEAHLYQIFSAQWGYGGGTGWLGAPPLQLGVAPLGMGIVALVTRPRRRTFVLAACVGLAALLSIVPFSGWWPWSWLLNEPWSLLGLASLCLAMLAARLATSEDGRLEMPLLAALLTFIVLASYSYLLAAGTGFTPAHLPLARYDDSAYLIDAEAPALHAGSAVTVTLLWQDIAPFTSSYKVFVHAIDAQNKVWAQRDAEPLDGLRPTGTWRRGELLRDPYSLLIPADAPSGLVIEAGLYRVDSGERFRSAEGGDRVIVAPRTP